MQVVAKSCRAAPNMNRTIDPSIGTESSPDDEDQRNHRGQEDDKTHRPDLAHHDLEGCDGHDQKMLDRAALAFTD